MNDHEDLNEYRALIKRNFAPYSSGHRLMYDIPISMLKNEEGKRYDILDIGVGIGYGLEQMLKAGVIKEYIGYEPCKETYDFMWSKASMHLHPPAKVTIVNDSWPVSKGCVCGADYSFAIEVIEHVPLMDQRRFIWELKEATSNTVFLSTPDGARSKHGVREQKDWLRLLKEIFGDVVVIDTQWTDLYICQY